MLKESNNLKIDLRIIYLFIYLFIESIFSLNIFVNSETNKNFEKVNNLSAIINKEEFVFDQAHYFKNNLKNNLLNSRNQLVNLIVEKKENSNKLFAIEIISDSQYQLDNNYYAEGNVVITFENGEIKADKLIYSEIEKNLILEGNISYSKGNQYIEASYLTFSFKDDKGYLEDVYGVLDLASFSDDLGYQFEQDIDFDKRNYEPNKITNVKFENSANIGLENTFESGKSINISDLNFDVPQINKWRFKAKKISIENDSLFSDGIFFTNDPFNKPQFLLESKKFSVKTIKDKFRIISKNTWVNLDDMVSFPIGTRRIIDRDPISRWGIGSDFEDKDGFYLFRSFNTRKIFDNYDVKVTPYLLIQRAIKGKTNSFVEKNASILSDNITQDISLSDYFAINTSIAGEIKSWDLKINADLNSLDFDKFSNASRGLVTLGKSIDFNPKKTYFRKNIKSQNNELNFQFYGAYRQKVVRDFTGDEEIYLGKGFTISNDKLWQTNKDLIHKFSLNYDLGEFEAKQKNSNNLKTSMRNVFTATYENEIPIIQKKNIDDQINSSYKYSPEVIKPGLTWISSLKSGIYFYGDDSQQKAISFSSGPRIILGSYKKKFLDYTDFNLQSNFIVKDGESPFAFDDVDKTQKLKFELDQQIFGPLLFSYEGYFNLDNNSSDFGKFSKNTYALNIKRRAYSVGAFYKQSSQAFGIKFNVNNFNYLGSSSRF